MHGSEVLWGQRPAHYGVPHAFNYTDGYGWALAVVLRSQLYFGEKTGVCAGVH